MLPKHLEKRQRILIILECTSDCILTLEVDSVLEHTNKLIVRVVNHQKNKPIQNITVKVFKIEKKPITPEQWVKNLKNGPPFKTLVLSMNTDNTGTVTAEFPEGTYEAKVEGYGFNQICELTQNAEVLVIEPKKHWWQ